MHKSGYRAVPGNPMAVTDLVMLSQGVTQAVWHLFKGNDLLSTAIGPMSLLTVTALADHLRRINGEKIDFPSPMTDYIEGL